MKLLMMVFMTLLLLEADEWKVGKESEGITVYTREIEGSGFLEFRGVTTVEGSVAALVSVLYDTPASPAWLHQCSFAMTLDEIRFEDNYIFQIYDLPFPVSNRQVILHSKLLWTEEGARLETKEANTYCIDHHIDRCESVNGAALIKIRRSRGHYIFTAIDEKRTKVIWQQHIEPGGSIPTWLANALVVDIPFYSLRQLQFLVKDERYRDMTEAKLRDLWFQKYQEHH
ncbi:MAG: START domain-containing protein [Helicobacteraceae bacterium]|jgi:hypothetical protein|nr:START domain-containing protein [Helicobacteraceae bacterium]